MSTMMERLFHRKHETATTVAEVLDRWPAAPAGACDICGGDISSVGTHRVTATEFKGIMRRGYNPYDTGRAPLTHAFLWGLSSDDASAGWRQLVERDTSDWGLCKACAEDVASFVVTN